MTVVLGAALAAIACADRSSGGGDGDVDAAGDSESEPGRDGSVDGGTPGSQRIRFVTWNIRFGTDRFEVYALPQQVAHLASLEPDVILLQEVTDPDGYAAGLAALDPAWQSVFGEGGVQILSRLPVQDSEARLVGPNSWGPDGRWGLRVDLAVAGQTLHVFNTHLDIAPDPCASTSNHIVNRQNFLAFTEEASGPRVLGGDLNAWTWSPDGCDYQRDTIAAFNALYSNACNELGRTETECNDYVTFHNQDGVRWRPDHLYRDPGPAFASYTVSDVALSDHKPVVVEVDVGGAP